ncbi:unnamed protein product, partial [Polarella glacialis]
MFCLGMMMLVTMHPVFPIALWGLDKAGPLLLERSGLLGTDVDDEPRLSNFLPSIDEFQGSGQTGSLVVSRSLQSESSSSEPDLGTMLMVILYAAINAAIFMAITAVVASYYRTAVTEKRAPFQVSDEWKLANNNNEFRIPLFSCFQDCQYCLHGFFCPQCRSADTLQAAGVNSYWTIIMLWLAVYALYQALATGISYGCLMLEITDNFSNYSWYLVEALFACFMATQRGKLRTALGGNAEGKYWIDCLVWWWCSCCATMQEALQVDGATNSRVECCCNLMQMGAVQGGGQMYGQAYGDPYGGAAGTMVVGQVVQ